MNRKLTVYYMILLSTFFLSGCWDSQELNDRAIELGWGIDTAKGKKIQISTQVIISSKIGGGQGNSDGGEVVRGNLFLLKQVLVRIHWKRSRKCRQSFPEKYFEDSVELS